MPSHCPEDGPARECSLPDLKIWWLNFLRFPWLPAPPRLSYSGPRILSCVLISPGNLPEERPYGSPAGPSRTPAIWEEASLQPGPQKPEAETALPLMSRTKASTRPLIGG